MTFLRILWTSLLIALMAACGAGGVSGSRPPKPPRPIPAPPAIPGSPGILAVAAGDGIIRIDYTVPAAGFEGALFSGPTRSTVYANAPIVAPVTGTHVILTGQPNNVFQYFGFGLRAVGETEWTQIGTIAESRPALVSATAPAQPEPRTYFVNPAADPNIANGRTPATAFPSLVDAMLVAFINNGGNVLVCDGTYTNGPFPLGPDVHVFGGFEPTFDFAQRNFAGNTRLEGSSSSILVDISTGSQTGILDNVVCDATNSLNLNVGVLVTDSNCQLRSVSCIGFGLRGIHIRLSTTTLPPYQSRRITAIASSSIENGLEGFLLSNVVADVALDRCVFSNNFAQGCDFNDLWSMDNNQSRLVMTGCVMSNNGSAGLAADFSVAPASTTAGGSFDVRIDGCVFERNAEEGVFLDQQYDGQIQWATQIRMRDCVARANALNGIRINADQPGNYLLNRLRCTANQGNGLVLNSKADPGELTVSSSWFAGNIGYGLLAGSSVATIPGIKRVFASNCAFAGNVLGGMNCTLGEGSATNCVVLQQPSPFTNVFTRSCFTANGASNPFFVAPNTFAVATSGSNGAFTLQSAASFSPAGSVELADDGVPLAITSLANTSLIVTPAPTVFIPPDMLFGFAGTSVTEDLRLDPASAAVGTGMAATGTSADPGPFGSPAGGAPGLYNPLANNFGRMVETTPPVNSGVTPTTPVVITLDRTLANAANLSNYVRCVTRTGTPIPANIAISGANLTVSPTGSGWPAAFVLELNAGIPCADGTVFGTPLVLPISLR